MDDGMACSAQKTDFYNSFCGREAITVNHSQYFTMKHIQTQPGLNKVCGETD
jgi:hypothetical protein